MLPLALGDVAGTEVGIDLERRDATPHLWTETGLDGAETSFSAYVRARAAGDDSITALPYFIMRGFRHRCIVVSKRSHFDSPGSLTGATIGVTGWPDSGNTWTRAVLRDHNVELDQVRWRVGRLTSAHSHMDRFGDIEIPSHLDVRPSSEPLLDALDGGRIDAVMTPFMPKSYLENKSLFRPLFPDTYAEEAAYYNARGYIPGIHLVAIRTSMLEQRPDYVNQLVRLFARSQRVSDGERGKLQDVTPWMNQALFKSVPVVGHSSNPVGLEANRQMIWDFQQELCDQHLLTAPMPVTDLFPYSADRENLDDPDLDAQF